MRSKPARSRPGPTVEVQTIYNSASSVCSGTQIANATTFGGDVANGSNLYLAYANGTVKLAGANATSATFSNLVTAVLANGSIFYRSGVRRPHRVEYPWVNEGFGTVAQDYTSTIALSGASGPLGAPTKPIVDNFSIDQTVPFFQGPQNFTLTGFAGLLNGRYGAGMSYGASYLFIKYLTDRYGNGFLRSLVTSTNVGSANIVYAVQQNGGGSITFQQLFQDFTTMLAVSNTGITNDPRYNMQSFPIRNASFPAQCAGCQSYTITGPATVGTLAAGQSAVVQNMFPGGFALFTMNGVDPQGNTIRLDDDNNGALNLFGAIGQQ